MYLLAVTDGTTIIQVHSQRCPNQLDDRKLSCKCVEGWLILVPDKVEEISGHDFFYILPDNVENTIERSFNLKDWN